jgi:hypothetical protein
MLQFLRRAVVVIFWPFLALFGLTFRGVMIAVTFLTGLLGWEIVWPPALADEAETEADAGEVERSRR